MTVIKAKRKTSQFEVFHHLNHLRKDITEFLLRDFGYKREKQEKAIGKYYKDRSYEELTEIERRRYDRLQMRWDSFEDWFIYDQRQVIVNCLRDITGHVYIANSIYPTCREELIRRRLHQDEAIGHCFRLVQELQYAIETLPVDINCYTRYASEIQAQINLIKGWRKSDHKNFSRVISDSSANFANVNNNGNANYNNASNSNGVRPDFNDPV